MIENAMNCVAMHLLVEKIKLRILTKSNRDALCVFIFNEFIVNPIGNKSAECLENKLFKLPNVGFFLHRMRGKQIKMKMHTENKILQLLTSGILIIRNAVVGSF